MLISGAIAHFVSGDLLKATNYTFIFTFVISMNVKVILYVIFWLKDIDVGIKGNPGYKENVQNNDTYPDTPTASGDESETERDISNTSNTPESKKSRVQAWIDLVCDVSYLTDSVRTVLKKRE